MLKDEHSKEGLDNAIDVSNKCQMEIVELDLTVILERLAACKGQIEVEFQAQWDKDTRDNQITKADHRCFEVSLGIEIWEDYLDGDVKIFSNCHHHISSIHPEDVIEEERPQQEETGFGAAETEALQGY